MLAGSFLARAKRNAPETIFCRPSLGRKANAFFNGVDPSLLMGTRDGVEERHKIGEQCMEGHD